MPKQRARSKRRAALSDLTERDLVIDPEVLTETANPPRGRKRVRNNGPNTSTAPVMTSASTTAQPTADEKAAAMIAQLRGAGLHLTDSSGVRVSDDKLSSVCGIHFSATQEAVCSTDYQTERQNTLPSSSTNAVHYSLVPHVTSDQSVAGYFTANSPTTQEDQSLVEYLEFFGRYKNQYKIYTYRHSTGTSNEIPFPSGIQPPPLGKVVGSIFGQVKQTER
ncbi:unnamed protein product [Mytilus coruscus]|uniref:Uncharacterized protein n=1 Tax=Mytilus coruscus TaxID=42192 RepID=A0A6J8CPQ7_MYTCO|nr:unnamed protein product [Mytilus coruscus]